MKFTYLLIDIFTVLLPVLFSFHPKFAFNNVLPAFLPALLLVAVFFVSGDAFFTSLKIWGFNSKYVTGYMFMNLPIEEVLFFFCIPYACIFTYHCLNVLYFKNRAQVNDLFFTLALITFLIVLAIIYRNKPYTLFAFSLLATLLTVTKYILRVTWLTRFYMTYAILLLPFFIVNGILTGTGLNEPVVWYKNSAHMGFRMLTIPVEDVFYGMALILMNVTIYTLIQRKIEKHKSPNTIPNV